MAVKVIEVELTQSFPSLAGLDATRYSHLQILVRKHRQPVGYAWVKIHSPRFLQEKYIRQAIETQLFDRLNQVALEQSLAGDLMLPFEQADREWPHVTVAICTRGRPTSLRRALESLVQLDYPAHKLDFLVVDNAPEDDETKRSVALFPECRYVQEPRPGLNWARNRAIREAMGDIIAFTDDDVEIDPLWVRALARHFENTAVMCVTGLVAPAERETPAQNLFEEYGGFGRGFERRYYTMGLQKHWPYWPVAAGIFGTGCNMAYRKAMFDETGLFDPALDVGTPTQGCGDHDMFYRTLRAGYILVYEPDAIVWHYHRRELDKLQDQLHSFGRGVYSFWTKIFLTDGKMRWRAMAFAMIWYVQWFLGRFLRLNKRFPRKLIFAEALGALQGPFAYPQSRIHARRISRIFYASDKPANEKSSVTTSHKSQAGLQTHFSEDSYS